MYFKKTRNKAISVAHAAALCGVGRTTVGYWIRSKKLCANRAGRNYSIPTEELLFFLKSSGKKIPDELTDGDLIAPHFRKVNSCWQFLQGTAHDQGCKDCTVLKNHLDVCFIGKNSRYLRCPCGCYECSYYQEIYFPRIQFIYQIDFPAAIFKDLYIWGGNKKWAELCEVQGNDLPGMGVEQLVHPDSLEKVISELKKTALGEADIPGINSIYLKNKKYGKSKVHIEVYPLNEPFGTNLILASFPLL
jgi:excisionase family DNA binding protein